MHRQRVQECWQSDKAVRNRMNSGEPGGNWGVIVERAGQMSSEMTEHERDGGLKADGETEAELRGGVWHVREERGTGVERQATRLKTASEQRRSWKQYLL
jgi:hypothetical protein